MKALRDWSGSKWVRGSFWAAAAFAFVMAVVPHPPQIPGAPNDKVQHIVAFATLALLGSWAYTATRRLKLLAWLSLFGAVIEIVQAIPMLHRDSDVLDWIADTAAVAIVLSLILLLRRRPSV